MTHCSRLLALAPLFAILSGVALADPPAFRLTSPDLPPNKPIPARFEANAFGCHGPNESPELHWTGAPAGTRSFAVTMYDTYPVPVSGWWHWIIYDLPPTTTQLHHGAGAPNSPDFPAGARQGRPDGEAPEPHYYGPCPDVGDPPHHYVITVYALSVDHLDVPPTATAAQIAYVISGKTIAKTSLVRVYRR